MTSTTVPTHGTDAATHFLDVDDLGGTDLLAVLDRAAAEKARLGREGHGAGGPLAGHTLTMVFEKPSTRTRVSFETAMTQLGGHAVFLGPDDIHLGSGEPIRDTARALSGYADAAMVRLFDHADAETFAEYASVPVINGLTDDAHPCQTLADLLTVRETVGFDASVAFVGDGNNVARSFALGAAAVGLDLTIATPEGYGVGADVLDRAAALGTAPTVTNDPAAAVEGADVVYTDVWVSMGQENRRQEKLAAFYDGGFQVDRELLGDAALMHCLPAHRGEEVTDDAVESANSLVWRQAENRLHAQKALLLTLLGA
jgi:ornithine carbamoyltransferase